ncbi:hypothetical protein EQ477_17965 [Salmonella enterica subsp. enterica serovar Telelkebir]|nr:hypothetical protein [Salmonella enterica subsp. enterica serovar Telelkebir]
MPEEYILSLFCTLWLIRTFSLSMPGKMYRCAYRLRYLQIRNTTVTYSLIIERYNIHCRPIFTPRIKYKNVIECKQNKSIK